MLKKAFLLTIAIVLSSCAAMKATNQPNKKDLSVLAPNTPRNYVIAELGKPVHTQVTKSHKRIDTYSFVQGYSKTNKTIRAVGHGVADVFTLGLWEVAGTPIEGIASGKKMQVEITYDKNNTVEKVVYLKK